MLHFCGTLKLLITAKLALESSVAAKFGE